MIPHTEILVTNCYDYLVGLQRQTTEKPFCDMIIAARQQATPYRLGNSRNLITLNIWALPQNYLFNQYVKTEKAILTCQKSTKNLKIVHSITTANYSNSARIFTRSIIDSITRIFHYRR